MVACLLSQSVKIICFLIISLPCRFAPRYVDRNSRNCAFSAFSIDLENDVVALISRDTEPLYRPIGMPSHLDVAEIQSTY